MSKDPAFLFYSSDFLSGTLFFSDSQVGKYVRLLCAQHQHGRLSKRQVLTIIGNEDEDILSKFEIDDKGLYFNKRLETESSKRSSFTLSRKKNLATSHSHMKSHMQPHMENENENKDVIKVEITLPHKSILFKTLWEKLLKQKKWKKKSQDAIEESLKKLAEHSEDDAIEMIRSAIAGEWQGLHEVKVTKKTPAPRTGNKNYE
jgi:hypothetical protein